MWRRRANRFFFSFLVALVVAPIILYVVAPVAIAGTDAIRGLLVIAGLPALIAVDLATRRSRWLPEPCLPPYPPQLDRAASLAASSASD